MCASLIASCGVQMLVLRLACPLLCGSASGSAEQSTRCFLQHARAACIWWPTTVSLADSADGTAIGMRGMPTCKVLPERRPACLPNIACECVTAQHGT